MKRQAPGVLSDGWSVISIDVTGHNLGASNVTFASGENIPELANNLLVAPNSGSRCSFRKRRSGEVVKSQPPKVGCSIQEGVSNSEL